MARQIRTGKKHETGRTITTPTPYGTTSDMVVTDEHVLAKVSVADCCVLVKDDGGYYITPKNRVDNGLADPSRHELGYREIMEERIAADLAR
jgi:hypothetical protein